MESSKEEPNAFMTSSFERSDTFLPIALSIRFNMAIARFTKKPSKSSHLMESESIKLDYKALNNALSSIFLLIDFRYSEGALPPMTSLVRLDWGVLLTIEFHLVLG